MSGPNETKKHRRDAWRRLVAQPLGERPSVVVKPKRRSNGARP